jgi:rsbT co-antagonist protein RsbR
MATLASRSELARRFFEISTEMLCVLDREGRIVAANPAWTELMGEITEEPLTVRTPDQAQAEWLRTLLQDGTQRSWSGYLRTAKGRLGRFQFVWGADEDDLLHVVARHLGFEALADRIDERTRALIKQTDLAIIELVGPGEILSWNPAAEAIFGHSAAEARGQSLGELIGTPEDIHVQDTISDALRAGRIARLVRTNRTRDGREIKCAWQFLLLYDEHGAPINMACCAQEVTEVEAQRKSLEEHVQILDAVLKGSPIIIWVVDRDGVITFSRGPSLNRLGLAEGQIVGQSMFDLYAHDSAGIHAIREAFAGRATSYQSDTGGEGGVSAASWQSHVTPFMNQNGEVVGALGVTYDITAQVHLAKEQEEHIQRLSQQQETIRILSTPILQVWDSVLALPLVGQIDERRAEQIMDALLGEIVRVQARHAILDVTGVEAMDSATVSHLGKLLQAIRLLGAEGILTGVRPAVAQSLVTLGEGLAGVLTLRDLQAGLKRCLKRS